MMPIKLYTPIKQSTLTTTSRHHQSVTPHNSQSLLHYNSLNRHSLSLSIIKPSSSPSFTITMKTPKAPSTIIPNNKSTKKTLKPSKPKLLKVIHPSPLITALPSSSFSPKPSDQPTSLNMHASSKLPHSISKGGGS